MFVGRCSCAYIIKLFFVNELVVNRLMKEYPQVKQYVENTGHLEKVLGDGMQAFHFLYGLWQEQANMQQLIQMIIEDTSKLRLHY